MVSKLRHLRSEWAVRVTACLDGLVLSRIHIIGKSLHPFRFWGWSGFTLGIVLALTLAMFEGLSISITAGLIVCLATAFLALAMLTKIIKGKETLGFYPHAVVALATAASFLRVFEQPLLPYLDVTVLFVGTFQGFGRLGCLMVGCCHGRPCAWGVRYGSAHTQEGFPVHLVGVRLFPTQVLEAMWGLLAVAAGAVLIIKNRPPGEALAWYIVAYATGRFVLEFFRGDTGRRYFANLSEAEWISLLLLVAVFGGQRLAWLPSDPWHFPVWVGFVLLLLTTWFVAGRSRCNREILNSGHLEEVLDLLNQARRLQDRVDSPIRVASTSQGLQISGGTVLGAGEVHHFTLSSRSAPLPASVAGALATFLVQRVSPQTGQVELIQGNQGIFHLLITIPPKESVPGLA